MERGRRERQGEWPPMEVLGERSPTRMAFGPAPVNGNLWMCQVESRTTRVGVNTTDVGRAVGSSTLDSSNSALFAAIASTGWWTVVNAGRAAAATLLSSKPTTATSSG